MQESRGNLGTGAVFLTSFTTILGAILFLRFGYAVAHVGLWQTWLIVLLGHLVTIPTALAVAEIATNQRVAGGGEYFIVSRSFGIPIGASIGVGLYLARSIAVAFYMIAFAEAFAPLAPLLSPHFHMPDARFISVAALTLLFLLLYFRGARSGSTALYVILMIIAVALLLFFAGGALPGEAREDGHALWFARLSEHATFFTVFAVIFPAFTGMTAGVGLSGDLRDPARSIPAGVLLATFLGLFVYLAVPLKLALTASPQTLAEDQLVMSRISLWGPAVPIGLACATLSSALGSIMTAPRILQAMARDGIFVNARFNRALAEAHRRSGEPRLALVLTFGIALLFIGIGDLNFVAGIITMFFMLTFGSLCLVSFLEHLGADPSYRPAFRSRWYISLFSAALCFWLMFRIQPAFALVSLAVSVLIHAAVTRVHPGMRGITNLFQGVIFQVSRRLQVFLQKSRRDEDAGRTEHWRPAVVCLGERSFQHFDGIDLMRWLSHAHGFGTYIHFIRGMLDPRTRREADAALGRLLGIARNSNSNVFFGTVVSPSFTSAVAQTVQLPGVSGKANNTVLFEFPRQEPELLNDIAANSDLLRTTDFDVLILGSSPRRFGFRRDLHVWLTENDAANTNLMLLFAYIILGHPDWRNASIKIRYVAEPNRVDSERRRLVDLVHQGRIKISPAHISVLPRSTGPALQDLVRRHSADADLVILGFEEHALRDGELACFHGFDGVGNILFVHTTRPREIS